MSGVEVGAVGRGVGGVGGKERHDEQLVCALRPVKTEETVSHDKTAMSRRWGPHQCEATCVLR